MRFNVSEQLVPLGEAEVFGRGGPARGSAMSLAVLGGVDPNQEARFSKVLGRGPAELCVADVVDFVRLVNVLAGCWGQVVGARASGQICGGGAFQGARDPSEHVPGVGCVRVGHDAERVPQGLLIKTCGISREEIAAFRQSHTDDLTEWARRIQGRQHHLGNGRAGRVGEDLVKDELESVRAIFENPRKACKATFAGLTPGLGQRRPVFLGAKVSHVLPPMGQIGVGGCAAVWSRGVSALGRAYTRLSLSVRSDILCPVTARECGRR